MLLRIFRNNNALEAGNLDDIHGGLVNLLVYSHGIDSAQEDEVDVLLTSDVMDFIFNEINDCIHGKKSLLYAPYVMILLIAGCEEHKFSNIQEKLTSVELNAAAAPYPGGPSTRRTRSASTDQPKSSRAAYFPVSSTKEPSPWVRFLMFMGMDFRKAQHAQYKDTYEMKS